MSVVAETDTESEEYTDEKSSEDTGISDVVDKVQQVSIHKPIENVYIEPPYRKCVRENITCILEAIIANSPCRKGATYFHSKNIPNMSIREYVQRLMKYCPASESAFLCSLVHIITLREKQLLSISIYSIHRLLLASILVCAKFYDDFYYNNKHYSMVGGITLSEMNRLEVEFLILTNFAQIDYMEYDDFYNELRTSVLHKRCTHALLPEKVDAYQDFTDHTAILSPACNEE